jgi:acyl carrier protein phosphodiesterase
MNFLAHLYLSFDDAELMLGNFIADEIKLSNIQYLPEKVQLGILLHRKIDAFTDDHIAFKASVNKFRPFHKKYSSVVVDIINDHLLYQNWGLYTDVEFHNFEVFAYDSLAPLEPFLKGKAKAHLHSLIKYKYLKAYSNRAGLHDVMSRMDIRTRFPSDFKASVDQLYDSYDFYDAQFRSLMDDMVAVLPQLYKDALTNF